MSEPALSVRVRRAARRPVVRWASIAALALLAVVWTESVVADARHATESWGRSSDVAVATHDLVAGRIVEPDDVTIVPRPVTVLATDPARTPVGRVVVDSIAAGEVVLERRLSGGGSGPAALLAPGEVAFALPAEQSTPTVHPGDHVDVFAPVDSSSRSSIGATRVAERATVVSVSDRAVMIGVAPTSAAAVARALLGASVVIALAE